MSVFLSSSRNDVMCKFTFSVRATLQKITAGPTNFSLFCKLQEKFRWGFHHFIIIIVIIIITIIIISLILFVYYFSFTFLRFAFFIVLNIKCAYVCALQETSPLSRYRYQTVVWTAAHKLLDLAYACNLSLRIPLEKWQILSKN